MTSRGMPTNREHVARMIRAHPTGTFTAAELADGRVTTREVPRHLRCLGYLAEKIGTKMERSGVDLKERTVYKRRDA